jgi:hypothetical protein
MSTSMVSTSNLQTPLTPNVLPIDNRYAVDSCDFSSYHSNLTDLGGEQLSQSVHDPAPHDSFDSATNASVSSTQTDADASYDSVGQGG